MNPRGSSGSQYVLLGAAMDSGNLGVNALATSVAQAVRRDDENAELVVFGNGLGSDHQVLETGAGSIKVTSMGMRLSRRYHRPESLQQMRFAARLPGFPNGGVSAIRRARACLDVSGGDSFTDMYGPQRFRSITMAKRLVLQVGAPLVLLPQTYGPYKSRNSAEVAAEIVREAESAWARDQRSYDTLRELLGDHFDPDRHRLGVDLAFAMSNVEPNDDDEHVVELKDWLGRDGPVAGLNVSGLLTSPLTATTTRDPVRVDYLQAMTELARRLLAESGTRLLLVPHVLGRKPGSESDELATAQLLAELDASPDRVKVIPTEGLSASTAKWWIGQCQWFCGTRMHSTIASLSSGVPTAAVAYSIKTQPVFATVGLADQVIDAQESETSEVVEFLFEQWQRREEVRERLAATAPSVVERSQSQMVELLGAAGRAAGV